jgi:hypothetical protein
MELSNVLHESRFQWPHGLRRGFVVVRLLGLRVRISPGAWVPVCRESCVLSSRGLCVGLLTHPEESYRVWCVSECDREASIMGRPWPNRGCCAIGEKNLTKILVIDRLVS